MKDEPAEVTAVPLSGDATGDTRLAQETRAAIGYLAVLAYPKRSEWGKRDVFVEAAKAWLVKRYTRAHKRQRPGTERRYRGAKNQQIDNALNSAFRRILRRRLEAAQLATFLILDSPLSGGLRVRVSVNDRRITARNWFHCRLDTAGAFQAGVDSGNYSEAALANEFHRTWSETKPVLHFALAYPKSGEKTQYSPYAHPQSLLGRPSWVAEAIRRAEWIRETLPAFIPNFNPAHSIRLIICSQ